MPLLRLWAIVIIQALLFGLMGYAVAHGKEEPNCLFYGIAHAGMSLLFSLIIVMGTQQIEEIPNGKS